MFFAFHESARYAPRARGWPAAALQACARVAARRPPRGTASPGSTVPRPAPPRSGVHRQQAPYTHTYMRPRPPHAHTSPSPSFAQALAALTGAYAHVPRVGRVRRLRATPTPRTHVPRGTHARDGGTRGSGDWGAARSARSDSPPVRAACGEKSQESAGGGGAAVFFWQVLAARGRRDGARTCRR